MAMCGAHDGVDIEQSEYGPLRVLHAAPTAAFSRSLLDEADPALLTVEGDRITVCGQVVYEVRDWHHHCGGAPEEQVLADLVTVIVGGHP